MAIKKPKEPLKPQHVILTRRRRIESLKIIGDGTLGIYLVCHSEHRQRLIAYDPKALKWLPFVPKPVCKHDGKEILNINHNKGYWRTIAKRVGPDIENEMGTLYIRGLAEPSDPPPPYEASGYPPDYGRNDAVKDKL